MAVHDDCPGLKVEILVDGKPLEEYAYEEENELPKTTTRYVECRSGTEFAINTNFKAPFAPMEMSIRVYLDGAKMANLFARKHTMLGRTYTQSSTKWKESGEWRTSNFLFSDLRVVEGNGAMSGESLEALNSIGIISVLLIPVLSYREKATAGARAQNLWDIGTVSEEAIKGDVRSHMIRLAPDKTVKPPIMWSTETADEPLATFCFKYRSIAALKSLGMIPRSPSPSPTPKPELIKQEKPHEPVPNTVAVNMSSATIPRPRTASVTPVPLRQRSSLPPQRYQPKLTKKNMLILLKHYRGSSEGLKGHPEKELTILLSHYRDEERENMPTKREQADDGAVRGEAKKRKTQVIVLDD